MIYTDRWEAGRLLGASVAARLADSSVDHGVGGRGAGVSWRQPHDQPRVPLVLALPRGGVPVGYAVAEAIGGELDVVVARKIGMPGQPEFGIGAVTPNGPPLLDRRVLARFGLTEQDLAPAVARERAEAVRRLRRYRGDRPGPRVTGRVVVVVDDGLATGVTARAALRALRAQRPARLIFAAPVCAPVTLDEADELICLQTPADFAAVGAWYADFTQLGDDEVERLLAAAQSAVSPPRRS